MGTFIYFTTLFYTLQLVCKRGGKKSKLAAQRWLMAEPEAVPAMCARSARANSLPVFAFEVQSLVNPKQLRTARSLPANNNARHRRGRSAVGPRFTSEA